MNKEEIENRIKELKNYTQEVWTDNEILQHDNKLLMYEKMLLQQENEQLRRENEALKQPIVESWDNANIIAIKNPLQYKIDEAIKYIEHHYLTPERTGMKFHECENVLDILKGE